MGEGGGKCLKVVILHIMNRIYNKIIPYNIVNYIVGIHRVKTKFPPRKYTLFCK